MIWTFKVLAVKPDEFGFLHTKSVELFASSNRYLPVVIDPIIMKIINENGSKMIELEKPNVYSNDMGAYIQQMEATETQSCTY